KLQTPTLKVLKEGKGTVELWDVARGKLLQTWKHEHPVERAAFWADGKTVLVVTDQGIHFWNAVTGERLAEPLTFDGLANARVAAFGPDGAMALVNGTTKQPRFDWVTQLWDLRTGKPMGLLPRDEEVGWAAA